MGGHRDARRRRDQRSGSGARGRGHRATERGELMTSNITGGEATGFLYPFIDSEETDTHALLDDLAASAHARDRDIAISLSTSGNSEDLMTAITEAKQRGVLTIGFSGHDGGRMALTEDLDFCFTVHSQSIHRIQESHAMLGYRLWTVTQE